MQTFNITLTNVTSHQTREVQVESVSVELAHKDGYFHHADKYEEIVSISDSNGSILYTEAAGFSTMPQTPPSDALPTEGIADIVNSEPGMFQRQSDNVNFF